MKIQLLSTLKKYKKDYLKQDIFSGIIIAAVSIPISMGYAQIAGLPPAYGLYGSILPILLFAIFSTSKQFIFGVDAAPAALAGSALLSLGIIPGSEAALNYIPILALFTGLCFLLHYKSRSDCKLYINPCYGRIHQWNLFNYYLHADSETYGKLCRIW